MEGGLLAFGCPEDRAVGRKAKPGGCIRDVLCVPGSLPYPRVCQVYLGRVAVLGLASVFVPRMGRHEDQKGFL